MTKLGSSSWRGGSLKGSDVVHCDGFQWGNNGSVHRTVTLIGGFAMIVGGKVLPGCAMQE